MEEMTLESFVNYCSGAYVIQDGFFGDLTIAEEGLGNTILHGIDKLIEAVKIAITYIQSFIVGLKKNKTLYITKKMKAIYDKLDAAIFDISIDNIADMSEEDTAKLVSKAEFMKRALERATEMVIDEIGDGEAINDSDIIEVPAAPYVTQIQTELKGLQITYKAITNLKHSIRTEGDDEFHLTSGMVKGFKESIECGKAHVALIKKLLSYSGVLGRNKAARESKASN